MNTIRTLFQKMSLVLVVFALTTVSVYAADRTEAGKDVIEVQVEELLNQIQKALLIVQNAANSENLPVLNSVQLKLSTEFVKQSDGKINIYIVSFGKQINETLTQSISLKLIPPAPETTKVKAEKIEISDALANAILSAARGAAKAKETKPALNLTELEASFKFVVKKGGGGGIKFTILPISAEIGASVAKAVTQEINISFK